VPANVGRAPRIRALCQHRDPAAQAAHQRANVSRYQMAPRRVLQNIGVREDRRQKEHSGSDQCEPDCATVRRQPPRGLSRPLRAIVVRRLLAQIPRFVMIAATKTARQLGRSTYSFNSSLADATETRTPSTPWCRSVDIIISRDASCDPPSLRRGVELHKIRAHLASTSVDFVGPADAKRP
jgi:hypothetical protein